jgi:hypothetical protein
VTVSNSGSTGEAVGPVVQAGSSEGRRVGRVVGRDTGYGVDIGGTFTGTGSEDGLRKRWGESGMSRAGSSSDVGLSLGGG